MTDHGNIGNKNAFKGDDARTERINLRIDKARKKRWASYARKKKKTTSQMIIDTIDKAIDG